MKIFGRLMREKGYLLAIVLLISLTAALFFLEKGFRGLQRRMDIVEMKIQDQSMNEHIRTYKIRKIRDRLDAFSRGYSPALETMIGLFLHENGVRHERWQAAAEMYARAFPYQPFDSERAWRYWTKKGVIQEAKR